MSTTHTPSYYAQILLPLMQQHGVEPTPDNYTVWYAYVSGTNKALIKEIDALVEKAIPFSDDINRTLFDRFFGDKKERKYIEETKEGAQRILSEILRIVTQYTGDTENYGKELDTQVEKMDQLVGDEDVQAMVKGIIEGARALKQSGQKLNEKLSESEREILALKTNLQKLSIESQKDFLTGVANRKAFDTVMEEYTKLAREKNIDICLLMVDVDHFKQFNDRFGHLIGDEVLKIVAKALTDTVRGNDVVARYGGEEFAVVLPATPLGGAMIVAEKIRQTIATHELRRKDTGETYGQITVSIGVACYTAKGDSILGVIKRADDALYRAKKAGRNQVIQETLDQAQSA